MTFIYSIELERLGGIPNKLLGHIKRDPGMRPRVGMQLCIKKTLYKILYTRPIGNPDNQSVTYIVEKFNPNHPFKPGINPRDARGVSRRKL